MIGKIISHYRIIRKIGSGGMGEVYLAEDQKLKREVALKFLPSQNVEETEKLRFIQEAQAAAAINHPNVCTVYEIDEQSDTPFIAMEYIDGKTIKLAVSERQLTFDECVSLALQICSGLSEAHQTGIIHRDIKSDNIMICGEDRIKIMDFGLAKLKGSIKLTKNTSTIGTLAYMAPEQIEGKDSDVRSDIFSFGIVLYEMITGELPFQGDYEAALIYSIINDEPEPVQNYRPDIPSELLHVINRAMEKDPENRYQSIDDMLIDLKRLKRDSSHISRTSLADIPSTKKPVTRKRSAYIAITAFILVCFIGFIIYNFWPSRDLEQSAVLDERSVAVMYFSNNTGDKNLDHWRRALADLMTTDLAQSKYLRVLGSDKLYDILNELDQLEEPNFSAQILEQIAEKGRVSHIIYGNITRAGEDFRIDINIKKPHTDELLSAEMVEGRGEESIFPMVDDLTTHVKQIFALSEQEISSDHDQLIANITTSSPEALRLYTLGNEKFDQRDYRESINYYEQAIKKDPEFAMAYRTAAIAYSNMGYWSDRQDYLKKAMELSHRVSLREKYLIEGDYYHRIDKQKAIDSYKKLLAIYPYDATGNINLGYLYNGLRHLDKAILYFKNAIVGDPAVFTSYMNTAWAYTEMAKYDSAKYYLDKYRVNYEDNESIRSYYSEFHLFNHEYDLALVEIEKALKMKPNDYDSHESKGDIYFCMGHLDSARSVYEKMLESDEKVVHIRARRKLWALALLQGQTDQMHMQIIAALALARDLDEKIWECGALFSFATCEVLYKNYNKALTIYEKIQIIAKENNIKWFMYWALHYKADMMARQGRIAEVLPIIKELKETNMNDIGKRWDGNYLYLQSKIAMYRGDYSQAIDSIRAAIKVRWQNPESTINALMLFHLARVYDQNGDADSAITYYNKLISLTRGRIYTGHLYVRSFYYLGKIYQIKGWEGKAIENYQKFLNLWGKSDFAFPEIGDARRQLVILGAAGNRQ